jgi:hypothetical protein
MKIYSRERWGARQTNPTAHQNITSIRAAYLHWTESGGREASFDRQAAHMRMLQNYHIQTRGWSDLGYHYVVFQPYGRLRWARVFEGRKLNRVPAAQAGANTNTCAIAVVMRPGDELKWATKVQLRRLVNRVKRQAGPPVRVRPHSAVTETTCPGDKIRAFIRDTWGSW